MKRVVIGAHCTVIVACFCIAVAAGPPSHVALPNQSQLPAPAEIDLDREPERLSEEQEMDNAIDVDLDEPEQPRKKEVGYPILSRPERPAARTPVQEEFFPMDRSAPMEPMQPMPKLDPMPSAQPMNAVEPEIVEPMEIVDDKIPMPRKEQQVMPKNDSGMPVVPEPPTGEPIAGGRPVAMPTGCVHATQSCGGRICQGNCGCRMSCASASCACCGRDPSWFEPFGDTGRFYASVGFYLIQPNFETNPAFGISRTVGTQTTSVQTDFTYGLDGAPMVEFGFFTPNGYGGRVRYFEFARGAAFYGLGNPIAGENGTATITSAYPQGLGFASNLNGSTQAAYNFSSDLNVMTWDFEATKLWSCNGLEMIGAAGVRYAHLAQNYRASSPSTIIDSGHNFNGAGPTIAFDATQRLGNSPLALYGKARGSVLFGSANNNSYRLTPETFNSASSSQSDVLPVGEIEIGLQADSNLGGGRLRVFGQIGFFGQGWLGAGNASNTESIFSDDPNSNGNFGFVGMAFRAGVNF